MAHFEKLSICSRCNQYNTDGRQIKTGRSTSQGQGIGTIKAFKFKKARCNFIAITEKN